MEIITDSSSGSLNDSGYIHKKKEKRRTYVLSFKIEKSDVVRQYITINRIKIEMEQIIEINNYRTVIMVVLCTLIELEELKKMGVNIYDDIQNAFTY